MRRISKILFLILFLLTTFCLNFSHAYQEDVITLDNAEIISLKVPQSGDLTSVVVNQNCEITSQRKNENSNYFDSEDDVFETKFGQIFSKFVDDKIINNKFNNFSSRIENELNARAP